MKSQNPQNEDWTPKRQNERFQFDAEYVRRLTEGDQDVEAHFAAYFSPLLTSKIRARLRQADLVEDARQATLCRVLDALRNKGGIAIPHALGAFVNSVCNNVLFETYRQQKKAPALAEELPDVASKEPSIETRLSDSERYARVRQVLSELPEKDRLILYQLYYEDRDKDEICRQFRVGREYLRVLVHRALNRFRARLAAGAQAS